MAAPVQMDGTGRRERVGARARALFGSGPTVGAGAAAKVVAEDVRELVRAEVALAKAEATQAAKEKATGVGLFAAAGALGWLALQGLLLTAGFALALVLPAWAAALLVSLVLLAVAAGAALLGRRHIAAPLSLDTTKRNVEQDVAWAKTHLGRR